MRIYLDRDDLFEILGILSNFRNYECCSDQMMTEEVDKLIKIIKLELDNQIHERNQE